MAAQPAMNAAIAALRSAVGSDKKQKANLNKIRDAFKAVEADEWHGSEMVERGKHFAEIISESVTSLHKTRPRQTLAFCAAAVSSLFKAKLEPALERGDEENAKAWEDIVFQGLMQPILSIVDCEDQDLDVVGNVLYQAICGIMRSPWSHRLGGRFARSLALVLGGTCSSSSNKAMLLDPSIFGSDTLSKLIIDAKDYHYLDTLLELSFNMFSSQGGKITRKTYAESIFGSGYALERLPDEISNELTNIHSVTNGGNSEKHVLDIMRTMSRAGIERPQMFTTKDLSYCGTKFTQTPPGNVIVLDYENLRIVFCDNNGESDVLSVATTTVKSVELVPQDASRIIVELVVAEQPLISSSREELAIPDSHISGSPLNLQFSIASSDVFGFEAALAARDLAGVLKDDNALTRHSSMASMKISNAVSSIPLKKSRNTSNDQAEEMIRKYVNLPSSRDGSSPPPVKRVRATTQVTQSRPLPLRVPITPTTASGSAAPQTEKLHDEPRPMPHSVAKQTLKPPVLAPVGAPIKQARPTTTRTQRAVAEESRKAIKLAALADLGSSELTDPGTTPQYPVQQTTAKTPADDATVLPTPPRTRARAQQTKPIAKTLVPATPDKDNLPEISSPPDVLSPKPVKKRKLVEDDPFELPPLKSARPTKQSKATATKVLPSSQYIRPRDTAPTRVQAKYGAISKRMRASSPIESIHSTDTDEDAPPKKAATAKQKKHVDTRAKDKASTQTRPLVDENDESDIPKRQTRAGAANAKSKPAIGVDTSNTTQNKDSNLPATITPKIDVVETLEPVKKKRGRPPKNKPTHQAVKVAKPPREIADSIEQVSSQPEPQNNPPKEVQSTATHGKSKIEPISTTVAHNATVTTREEASEDDDLLERLSQAAKKTLKPLVVDNQPVAQPDTQPIVSLCRTPSPVKTLEIEMEDPDIEVDVVEPLAQDLETHSREEVTRQTWNATFKPVGTTKIHSTPKPPSVRSEKEPKGTTNMGAEKITAVLDVPRDTAPKPKTHVSATHILTGLPTPKDIPIDDTYDEASVDIIRTKELSPIPPRTTKDVTNKTIHQPKLKPVSTTVHIEARIPTLQERIPIASPENPVQQQSARITKRIQPDEIQDTVVQSFVRQAETPPAKDTRRSKFPPVFISVDSNSDVEMEPFQELASHAVVEPVRRPSVLMPRTTSTTRPTVKPQFHTASTPVPAPVKAKHAALTRVLFEPSPQLSPKSALASPQRRTLPNGTRPSVSFLEPPIPLPLSRRGSSGSSTEGTHKQRAYGIDREKLKEGHSGRTGDVMLQITDVLADIQEIIVTNIGEKIQTVNTEARSARAELTKGVIEGLDRIKTESESHLKVLHDFESAFASQAQAMLEGLGRVVECNDRMNAGIKGILSANARAGQSIVKSTPDFQVPELFNALLTS